MTQAYRGGCCVGLLLLFARQEPLNREATPALDLSYRTMEPQAVSSLLAGQPDVTDTPGGDGKTRPLVLVPHVQLRVFADP